MQAARTASGRSGNETASDLTKAGGHNCSAKLRSSAETVIDCYATTSFNHCNWSRGDTF